MPKPKTSKAKAKTLKAGTAKTRSTKARTVKASDKSVENLKSSLKEYNDILGNLRTIQTVKKAPLSARRSGVGGKSRAEKNIRLRGIVNEACNMDAYADIDRLIGLTQQSYQEYKALPGKERNTHEFITEQAIALLGVDSGVAQVLHQYCTYPDASQSDMCDLIFEGHFYGKTGTGAPGNFLVDMFPKTVLYVIEAYKKFKFGKDEDISENAVMNFTRYYDQVQKAAGNTNKHFYLGVAAHFLQDLTAPHHTGNYPAVPYVDHYFFEKFTSRYVYDQPAFKISKAAYANFKKKMSANPTSPEAYALEVTGKATPFIQYIETDLHTKLSGNQRGLFSMDAEIDKLNDILLAGKQEEWEKAIVGAIPLAVYATTYLFETALA